MYAIVLAGGVGTRLWPRSRNNHPKQLISLISQNSLLQETITRLGKLMPFENIVIVTGENHAGMVKEQISQVPSANILTEPAGRGTAPAIGLGLLQIKHLARAAGEKDPVIGSFHADHVITRVGEFCRVVKAAEKVAEEGYIVTLGIKPDSPHTGYGYIQYGEKLEEIEGLPVYRVGRFVEKPPLATAEEYVASGNYSWNSGMFLWQLSVIMEEYQSYLPRLCSELEEIEKLKGFQDKEAQISGIWNGIKSETIDVGIAEKSSRMAVLPADIGWNDVGDWSAVAHLMTLNSSDETGNAVSGQHLGFGTKNSLIYCSNPDKLIATIGLEDLIVVDTGDVLMVARRSQNQDVKKIVEKLKQLGLDKFL